MSDDISIPNFIIIGGGPIALLSAYYINLVFPTSSIVILDNRGIYTRGEGWEFTISVDVIKYLKETFSDDKNFIKFLDDITKILKKCNTFPINALEIALYNNLKYKIYVIKCKVSLDKNKTLVINKIDSNNSSEDCCQRQIDFLKKFKTNYIFNCTGGRLNTRTYWKDTLDETKEYLLSLTNNCLQIAGIQKNKLHELNDSLLPTSEDTFWYIRSLQTLSSLPHRGFQDFDKLSVLKPSTKIKIPLEETVEECPLFNIGDSIMTVDYRKKIGLSFGISNIRIILNMIIIDPNDNLEDLYVERIIENFNTLSQKLLFFCTINEYLYFVRDPTNEKYKYFNLLTDKGTDCNLDYIAPDNTNIWSKEFIDCTLKSNPNNLTEYELNKCLAADDTDVKSYNDIQTKLHAMKFNQLSSQEKLDRKLFDKLITQGIDLKKKLIKRNLYQYIEKKVHLQNSFYPFDYHKKGDIKLGGKKQNKKTKKQNKKTKKYQKQNKKTKNI